MIEHYTRPKKISAWHILGTLALIIFLVYIRNKDVHIVTAYLDSYDAIAEYHPEIVPDYMISGTASYYSKDGCMGCHPQQIMANGEQFNESALTLAMVPATVAKYNLMNETVKVTNIDTGNHIYAKVSDTGGFNRYNRIADLSLGSKQALHCSDLCGVMISWTK